MSVQVSYKNQFVLGIFLIIIFLVVIELVVNVWVYNFYRCDFEDDELFQNVNPEINRKICLESLGYGFAEQKLFRVKGTTHVDVEGGIDEKLVNINSYGFRGPEFTENKEENTYRIFTVGGSTTFGIGVIDNQTFPYYIQEFYDQNNFGSNIEVINAGWPGSTSIDETGLVKERLINFEPDLLIVMDPFNDAMREFYVDFSAIQWKERWKEICELGEQHRFDTIIIIQPTVGAGKKLLTEQELKWVSKDKQVEVLEFYPSYIEELNDLKNHCSLTADFTNIFDHISEPIYYDKVHSGKKGNKIIAKEIYHLSLPLIQDNEKIDFNENYEDAFERKDPLTSNNFDHYLEEFNNILRSTFSQYKTPRVFSLIFQ